MNLTFALEVTLSLLLAVTLAYCIVLERRLTAVQKGQKQLGNTVRELNAAITSAGAALSALRAASGDATAELNARVREARELADELSVLTASGERIAERMDQAVSAQKSSAPASPLESMKARLDALRTVR